MKSNLVMIAAMLLFGTVAAQTTTRRVTVYHQNGTVELHIAVTTIDTVTLKTLKRNEVSEVDADNYLTRGITVVGKMPILSMLYGPMTREKIVREKNNNLHYETIRCAHDIADSWLWIVTVLSCIVSIAYYSSILFKKNKIVLAFPIATGILFSIGTDIDYYTQHYDVNWDEQVGYAALGFAFFGILLLYKWLMPIAKSYWFRKKVLWER